MSDLAKITWALPGEIAVSDVTAASDPAQLREFGIRSILALSERHPMIPAEELGVEVSFARRIKDALNEQWEFDDCVEIAEYFYDEFAPLLIRCKVGRSRSLAVTAALLMRLKKRQGEILTVDEAIEMVRKDRPNARVYPELMPNLINFVP